MHFVHHQAGSIYKKPPECQSLTSEHKPGRGSERGCYHTTNVSSEDTEGRDPLTSPAKREVCSLPHCHPTERRTIIFMNKARPGVGTAATGFPTASNTVIEGVTRAGRRDRRSRVWPQEDDPWKWQDSLTSWPPCQHPLPPLGGTFTKEVSNICNYQPLYLVTMNIKTLLEKIFK